MTSERSKKTADKAARKDHATTPESATSLEKERLDDDAVEKAVTVDRDAAGPASILPCPPIPPKTQRRERESRVTEDSRPSKKKAPKKTSSG